MFDLSIVDVEPFMKGLSRRYWIEFRDGSVAELLHVDCVCRGLRGFPAWEIVVEADEEPR